MGLGQELDDITVISIDQAVAAPYCSLLLADAGARVIKVERNEGDFARGYDQGAGGNSAIFAWLNRGKESICINLNDQEDIKLLHRMIESADVFLHNLAPGALAKRGFDGETLRKSNPALITCEITGYGATGPAASKKAYDFLVQAESGVCSVTGSASEPSRVGLSLCDIGTGLTAFSAILRALIKRGKTNSGLDISISMFDVMADWMNMPLVSHRYMGIEPKRMGLTHSFIVPYGAFTTGDNHQVLLSIQSNREWCIFCEQILQQAEMGTDPRFIDNTERVKHRQEVHEMINQCFGQFSREQVIEKLDAARIANAQLSSIDDLSSHPFLRELSIEFGETTIDIADLPVQISNARQKEVPQLNQHGDVIRHEFKDN